LNNNINNHLVRHDNFNHLIIFINHLEPNDANAQLTFALVSCRAETTANIRDQLQKQLDGKFYDLFQIIDLFYFNMNCFILDEKKIKTNRYN
jgi:hypothetical protein